MSFTAKITADASGFDKAINDLTRALDNLQTTIDTQLGGFAKAVEQNAKSASNSIKSMQDRLVDTGKSLEGFGNTMSYLSAGIGLAGGAAFNMAADFEDAIGATGQIFKDASDDVKKWAESLEPYYGIAKKEALEYSNMMGAMLQNIGGMAADEAAKTSGELVKLAGDLTATFGGRTQDAVRALQGALKGNNTMLDNYGIAANDALVKTKAFEMGLISQGKELQLREKQLATIALIYEQTGAAQGQAAREAESASGAMRVFRTEVTNLSTELGEVLLPIITPVITELGEMVTSFRNLSPEMQSLTVGVLALGAALGPVLVGVGKLLQLLPQIRAAAIALTGPIGMLGASMVVVAVNFHKNVEMIKTDWDFLSDHLQRTSKIMGDVLKGDLTGWWDEVQNTWNTNSEMLGTKFQQIKEYFTGVQKSSQSLIDASNIGMNLGALGNSLKELTAEEQEIERLKEQIEALQKALADAGKSTKEVVDTFRDGADVAELIRRTTSEITTLQERLDGLRSGTIVISGVKSEIEKTENRVRSLTGALDTLTNGLAKMHLMTPLANIKADPVSGLNVNPVITPTIDTSQIDLGMQQISEKISASIVDMSGVITNAITSFSQSFGTALGSGSFENFGAEIIKVVGQFAQQFGALLVAAGVAAKGFHILIKEPLTAIAAGAALIAVGAAATAAANKQISNLTGGYSAGYSGGGASYFDSVSPGPSDLRGPYQDNFTIELIARGDNLYGVLSAHELKRRRII